MKHIEKKIQITILKHREEEIDETQVSDLDFMPFERML